jgi:hypothetical protein
LCQARGQETGVRGRNFTVGFATQVIGLVGFEPTASWSRTRRSTKLSHSPNCSSDLPRQRGARPYFAYFATPGKRFSLRWHPISVKQAEFARVSPHARARSLRCHIVSVRSARAFSTRFCFDRLCARRPNARADVQAHGISQS